MKYELLLNFTNLDRLGVCLYRIRALKDFSDVKKGDLGGYVENESNLSQEGNCWIYDNAEVFGKAKVSGDSIVFGEAKVYGEAKVLDRARICGNSIVIDSKVPVGTRYYSNHLIIPKDHPDFWDYRLEHPELEVIYLDK